MLNLLTRKLCPFVSLAIATVGCGKKISESDTVPSRTTENQELPATMVIELDGAQSSSKTHSMPRNGTFELPSRLLVTGNATNKTVEIIYDLDRYDNNYYQFKCSYVAVAANDMRLSRCQDSYGGNFGNVAGAIFNLYKGDQIKMRFVGTQATDLKVEAAYTVDWK